MIRGINEVRFMRISNISLLNIRLKSTPLEVPTNTYMGHINIQSGLKRYDIFFSLTWGFLTGSRLTEEENISLIFQLGSSIISPCQPHAEHGPAFGRP